MSNELMVIISGGGTENTLNYKNTILYFGNIANIHAMYDAWFKLHAFLNQPKVDETKWLSTLESTQWLHVKLI